MLGPSELLTRDPMMRDGGDMTLVLNDDDVMKLLPMEDCITVLEEAFTDLGRGTTVNAPRRDSFLATSRRDGYYSFKSIEGGLERLGIFAQRINSDCVTYTEVGGDLRRVKVARAPGGRYVGLVFLYSVETLELLAIITDGHLQRMRVAGTTGVGVKHLARPDAKVAALIGSGWQAETAAWALAAVRKLSAIRVYSPNPENRRSLARRLGQALSAEAVPVESAEEAVRGADIVATATNAQGPVVQGAWVEEGMHLTCISSTEFDDEAWRRSHLIIASSFPEHYQARRSGNELLQSFYSDEKKNRNEHERNLRYAEKIYPLSDLLLGKAPGRAAPAQITLLSKRWGLGIEFASVGKLVYDRARARGIGKELPTEWFSQTSHP